VRWRVELTAAAESLLNRIKDRRVQAQLIKRMEQLTDDPEQQGKPLSGDLFGYYSVRAVGQRYRIIYQLNQQTVIIHVIALGIRKQGDKNDIYTLAQRLFRQRLLAPDSRADEE
jgi:mRNA interferase RelE/StbE